jgi:hypothetical protein
MRAKVGARLSPVLVALLTFASPELKADEPSPSEQAVRLGHDGLSLYESAHWDEAFVRFERFLAGVRAVHGALPEQRGPPA